MSKEVNPQAPTSASEDQRIALIDVDGTLFEVNSLFTFLDQYHRDNTFKTALISSRKLPVGKAFWYLMTRATGKEWFRFLAIRSLRGACTIEVDRACETFVNKTLAKHLRESVVDLLEAWRAERFLLVLASGSIDSLVRPVSKMVAADGFLASTLESSAGQLTGQLLVDVRGRKFEMLSATYPNISELVTITDNFDDLELINASSQAFVISKSKHHHRWERILPPHAQLVPAK